MTATLNCRASALGEVNQFNTLLRGELTALETYLHALPIFTDDKSRMILCQISNEHAQAVSQLRGRILALGGQPANTSGLWGSFVTVVTGVAIVFGPETVLVALSEGEDMSLNDHKACLESVEISDQGKSIIHDSFMGRTRDHIFMLHRLIADYRLTSSFIP